MDIDLAVVLEIVARLYPVDLIAICKSVTPDYCDRVIWANVKVE